MNDEAQKVREYPIETDSLAKGSRISGAVIAEAFGVRVGTTKFGIALMQAGLYIERRLSERGLDVVTAQNKNDLVILTDEEAVNHTASGFRAGLRRAFRNNRKGRLIDRAALAEATRDKHDRELELQGRVTSAIRSARATFAAIPSKRATPLPPGYVPSGDAE